MRQGPCDRYFELVTRACQGKGWCWQIKYSECEDTYYADAGGQGMGELVEVKRVKDPARCLHRLLEKIESWRLEKGN